MSFPLRHSTILGKKLTMSQEIEDWVTPNWNYSGVTKGLKLGHEYDFDTNFNGVNVANELAQTRQLQIGATDSNYSDYNFAVGDETKFTCCMQFQLAIRSYSTSPDVDASPNTMGTRMMIIDHFDDHNDSGVPADGWGVYVKPSSTADTQQWCSVWLNVMGTELRLTDDFIATSNFNIPLSVVFSYDSSLTNSENIKGQCCFAGRWHFVGGAVVNSAAEQEQVSVTGNPTIGRAKQVVTYGTNNIVKIVASGGTSTVTLADQHRCFRRGTQVTLSGTTNYNAVHTIKDLGLRMKEFAIATPGGAGNEGSDGSPLNATWAYETYEPIMGRGERGFFLRDLVFWEGVAASEDEIIDVTNALYYATNNGPHWNELNIGALTTDKLYSWHCMGDGLENGVFDSNNNKIYNMSAVGGWQRNIVDRDIQTAWQGNSFYDPVIYNNIYNRG
jgi:hypothetical protein